MNLANSYSCPTAIHIAYRIHGVFLYCRIRCISTALQALPMLSMCRSLHLAWRYASRRCQRCLSLCHGLH